MKNVEKIAASTRKISESIRTARELQIFLSTFFLSQFSAFEDFFAFSPRTSLSPSNHLRFVGK